MGMTSYRMYLSAMNLALVFFGSVLYWKYWDK